MLLNPTKFYVIVFSALFASFAHADVDAGAPAVKSMTTPSYDFIYVDNIVQALVEAGAKNVAPADAPYALYQPGEVLTQSSGPEEEPKYTVIAIRQGTGWSWSKPLDAKVAAYVGKLFYAGACSAGYTLPTLVCLRTVDLDGSYCTATYQCLKAN